MKPRLTLIAAVARNGVIGKDNAMPWRLPEDLKRFKVLTMGHSIIMGRKTWTSLGRALPGRHNIVISRDPDYAAAGATVVNSLAAALAASADSDEVFVIGGAEIYALALTQADRLQLTEIAEDFAGDSYFPQVDRALWQEMQRQRHQTDAGMVYDFVVYQRT